MALLKDHTPSSAPSHPPQPWWSPHLTILRREYQKGVSLACILGTLNLRELGNLARLGYFKAIKVAKNKHWSSFLLSATPQNLWASK